MRICTNQSKLFLPHPLFIISQRNKKSEEKHHVKQNEKNKTFLKLLQYINILCFNPAAEIMDAMWSSMSLIYLCVFLLIKMLNTAISNAAKGKKNPLGSSYLCMCLFSKRCCQRTKPGNRESTIFYIHIMSFGTLGLCMF